jgi:hypothetical protein
MKQFFSYYYCLMIEGSRSLTNGSESLTNGSDRKTYGSYGSGSAICSRNAACTRSSRVQAFTKHSSTPRRQSGCSSQCSGLDP